ncbi:MAG: beta-galactosidase trimerization domain-containing protein, partial [Demequina sp.]|uniref:beta-galactosidase trimerization domain-containing protein n=1 Tax=Demequina sp. TaxID=2050685 RepID=UPI003A8AEE7B
TVDAWAEDIALAGAEVRGSCAGGPGDALPAVTRHQHGEGTGWYVGARLTPEALAPVIAQVYADAGISPEGVAEGLETITRRGADHDFVIAVNHREDAVSLSITGTELLSGTEIDGTLDLKGGDAAVVRIARAQQGGGA